ncbi:hypothetical protein niasHT_036518 [Heterodera trifolii]|uniref:Uncharacterized protein n=1 Tax=Heterodera trifolii TaxID=157864 RepID=A0ABD2J0C8_9BILA
MQHLLLLMLNYTSFFSLIFLLKFTFFVPTFASPPKLYPVVDQGYGDQHHQNQPHDGTKKKSTKGKKASQQLPYQGESSSSGASTRRKTTVKVEQMQPPQQQHPQVFQQPMQTVPPTVGSYGATGFVQQQQFVQPAGTATTTFQPNYNQQQHYPMPYGAVVPNSVPIQQTFPSAPPADFLTGTVPGVFPQQQLAMNSAVPSLNTLMKQMSIGPNQKGTMEIYYTETEQTVKGPADGQKREIVWEIYRQRDNSGQFVKFRHVHKLSGKTGFSCVAPWPSQTKGITTLFFNNNSEMKYQFDVTGYMIVPEEQFSVDELTGKPTREAIARRMYSMDIFQNWIQTAIDSLLKDNKWIMPPVQMSALTPPVEYPPGSVLEWIRQPLPVHPNGAVCQRTKIGFMSLDMFKKTQIQILKENKHNNYILELMECTEHMDDGGNWVKIQSKQLELEKNEMPGEQVMPSIRSAIFVRDRSGQPPTIEKPMALFFNGLRQYFDKTGMAISRFAVEAVRKWEEAEKEKARANPDDVAFFEANITKWAKDLLAKQREELAQMKNGQQAPEALKKMQQEGEKRQNLWAKWQLAQQQLENEWAKFRQAQQWQPEERAKMEKEQQKQRTKWMKLLQKQQILQNEWANMVQMQLHANCMPNQQQQQQQTVVVSNPNNGMALAQPHQHPQQYAVQPLSMAQPMPMSTIPMQPTYPMQHIYGHWDPTRMMQLNQGRFQQQHAPSAQRQQVQPLMQAPNSQWQQPQPPMPAPNAQWQQSQPQHQMQPNGMPGWQAPPGYHN